MLEQLIGSIKDQIGPAMSQFDLDSSKVDDVAKLSAESIGEGMMEKATSGGMDDVLSLFMSESPTSESNDMVSNIVGSLSSKLGSQLGLDSSKAQSIASSLVPMLIDFLGKKFRNSSEHENSVSGLADFVGLDSGGLMDKAKDLLGGKLGGLFGK